MARKRHLLTNNNNRKEIVMAHLSDPQLALIDSVQTALVKKKKAYGMQTARNKLIKGFLETMKLALEISKELDFAPDAEKFATGILKWMPGLAAWEKHFEVLVTKLTASSGSLTLDDIEAELGPMPFRIFVITVEFEKIRLGEVERKYQSLARLGSLLSIFTKETTEKYQYVDKILEEKRALDKLQGGPADLEKATPELKKPGTVIRKSTTL